MGLILLDIDGTLIGKSGEVDEAIWPVADEVARAGVRLAVCTGRTHAGVARQIAERLDPDAPHVFHNGALVATAAQKVLDCTPLDQASLRRLVDHARRLDATIELYTLEAIYVDRITPECAKHAEVLDIEPTERDLSEVIADETVIRAHWIVSDALAEQALELDLPDCHVTQATSPALPGCIFGSVTHAGASKGSGARFAAEYCGVPLDQVVAVGDGRSDIPMLEVVGHPFIMGDAADDLLERFPSVNTVEENGVLEALRHALDLLDARG